MENTSGFSLILSVLKFLFIASVLAVIYNFWTADDTEEMHSLSLKEICAEAGRAAECEPLLERLYYDGASVIEGLPYSPLYEGGQVVRGPWGCLIMNPGLPLAEGHCEPHDGLVVESASAYSR